ncbi:RNA recognition motif domain-containing protein [Alkalilimnicola ehrlichii MLHE-1]|uniref:RNP-1 like RNA-binding protein n=1 Tax=Alkalilimnicola ehrlichii (strain ATCC BAA-1101 / DSM 17681 / MLHE-1) TaxID=187272 RepID=Q0AB19_ALKEH|nr:RNP-1 like RNA-binding protein [Alkalilimnicola ehrlichii]ABI55968.1 RNP-1 like RNA-binding protein [Alkalilimnicola ehrlichii MLHE-1]
MDRQQLYVGNLPTDCEQGALEALFRPYGEVCSARLVRDRSSGEPRGFAFVEMEVRAAEAAMAALDGQPYQGQRLRVNRAHQKQPRGPRALRLRRRAVHRHA